MPLTNEQALDIMKKAYAENYQGKFNDLFQQAEQVQGGPDVNAPYNQASPKTAPTQPVSPTDPVLNPSPSNMVETGDRMVESFQAADPSQMPTGERVRDVLNPGEYKTGGYRLIESLPSYQKGMSTQASDYIQGYKRKK